MSTRSASGFAEGALPKVRQRLRKSCVRSFS
jgi:hypothetical protein